MEEWIEGSKVSFPATELCRGVLLNYPSPCLAKPAHSAATPRGPSQAQQPAIQNSGRRCQRTALDHAALT
eukprot:3536353-Rhodomonas_salina.1